MTGLDAESSAARDRLLRHAERVGRIGQRLEEQRLERSGARQAGKARSARPGPVGRPVRP